MSSTTQIITHSNGAAGGAVITTNRLILRPSTFADAPDMARLANNLKIAGNMRNTFPSPYLLEHAEGWLTLCAKDPGNYFAICRAEDGAFVGNMGIIRGNDVLHRTWELGYWIGEEYWGQGFASEALVALCRFCFEQNPELLRLEASMFSTNAASRRVLEKAGWTYEGTKRQAVEKEGQVLDLLLFSILRHESLC
ncbi:putative Na(+)/H(+) antiporter [Colletotrichum spaethianum]|uniref:Na(+)/H(+) antiporter n=1 Tax=Colletotrichum spaethianum TaxID=700344 RepID=A0AA37PA17_9PEZI|nr:putative Na(+)/H(+) antiporter [Colletotrichum spaethianum]GKT48370.1 putative Na(+)/H(+) antiporter [Colletotrichum spaethianum]